MIKRFCEESEGKYEFYKDYSGRMMFGRLCVGITCDNVAQAVYDVAGYLGEYGVSLGKICHDQLGMGHIVYFPEISFEEWPLFKALKEFCEKSEGAHEFYKDYKSVTFNGEPCIAISCESLSELLVDLTTFLDENGVDDRDCELCGLDGEINSDGEVFVIFPFVKEV